MPSEPLIGLMLIRNENDILAQVLREHLRFADHIFVLDGTTEAPDETRRICCELGGERLSFHTEDELPAGYPRPIRDGCRQFLVERARERFGCAGWFVLLHADEIFVESPADIVRLHGATTDIIEVKSLLYFIHREQAPFVYRPQLPLDQQIYWYSGPGYPEVRLVRNREGCHYDPGQHFDLVPRGLSERIKTAFRVRHYPYRDAPQQERRAIDRTEVTGFSPSTYRHVLERKYYLDEEFFHYPDLYAWISRIPPVSQLAVER
jgi:hypothetical protein